MASKIDTSNALTMNQLIPLIKRCIYCKRPAFIWGGPGIGKSDGMASLAKELGGLLVDVRLSYWDPTDIKGIPYYNKELNKMCWAPPDQLPFKDEAEKWPIVILFMDEMNSATPSVQAAAYQLVHDRKVGNYTLPENVVVIAAGNRETDRGVTYRMPAPLSNRFVHFELKEDFDSWLDWAVTAKIHGDIIAFLATFKHKLNEFDPSSPEKAFPTPRTYEFGSGLITTEPGEPELDDTMIRQLLTAAWGAGTATEFMAFRKIGKDLPKPADILSGKVREIKTREISAHYQLIMGMLHELQNYWYDNSTGDGAKVTLNKRTVENRTWKDTGKVTETWKTMLDNFNAFTLRQVDLEVGIMAQRIAYGNYNFSLSFKGAFQPGTMSTWQEVVAKFGKYILDTKKAN